MLKNYLKIAIRNSIRHKLHTIINTLSLSIGIACGILILLFINEELTFDSFHTKADGIYRLWLEEKYEGEEFVNSVTPLVLAGELKSNFPEVKRITQYHPNNTIVKVGDETFNEIMNLVSPDFFEIFDFETIEGSTISIFTNRNDLVLSKDYALKYFGENDPIGEVLDVQIGDGFYPMTVKAVVETHANSSIQFDILASNLNNDKLFREGMLKSWYNVITETYILTDVLMSEMEAKLPDLVKQGHREDYEEGAFVFHLQPLKDIHLNTEIPAGYVAVSDPQYAYILGFIAFFIILLGSINFVTLSIGKSVYRAKEVGVRKVSGAVKSQLAFQFLSESLVIAFLSGLFGLILAYLVLPAFNELANRQLELILTPFILVVFGVLVLVIGLGAGIYPAMVLSNFQPITVLKGNVNIGRGKQNFRKGMVIVQFVISIFLLTTTLLMQRQLNFLQDKHLGYDSESILTVPVNAPFKGGMFATMENAYKSAVLYKQELDKNSNIVSSGIAYQKFGDLSWIELGFKDQSDNYRKINHNIVDFDLFRTMGLEVVIGRSFDKSISSDATTAVIVNEAAVKYFGWDNPLERKFEGKRFGTHQIIGVVKDFNYQSLHGKIEPLVMAVNPELILRGSEDVSINSQIAPTLHIKVNQENLKVATDEIQSSWESVFPTEPFTFDFLDERLRAQYEQEESLRQIVSYSSILALVIGALGLFGLVTLAINGRIKEIGIRKVLGASLSNLFYILSKDYILMIFLAMLFSVPVSIYFIKDWMSSFEYRITIPMDVFIISGLAVILISFLTISYNVLKASRAQPVETLKCE